MNPGSPVSAAAELIASAAGLKLVSDNRAEILHYDRTPQSTMPALAADIEQIKIRPWLTAMYAAVGLAWVIGWYFLARSWFGDVTNDSRIILSFALIAIGALATTLSAAIPITIDSEGIGGASFVRNRYIPWADLTLIHGVADRETPIISRRVRIVRSNGRAATLQPLTKAKVSHLAAAVAHYGRPQGIDPDLPAGDFARRYGHDHERITSAIAIDILGWKL